MFNYPRRLPLRLRDLPPSPEVPVEEPDGLLNLIQAPPWGSLLVSKFAALIASISFPGRDFVEPIPKIETNVSSSIVSGIIIPEDNISAFFSAIFF